MFVWALPETDAASRKHRNDVVGLRLRIDSGVGDGNGSSASIGRELKFNGQPFGVRWLDPIRQR
jgi:hypothetical protein